LLPIRVGAKRALVHDRFDLSATAAAAWTSWSLSSGHLGVEAGDASGGRNRDVLHHPRPSALRKPHIAKPDQTPHCGHWQHGVA
jgi:hypothetical protein